MAWLGFLEGNSAIMHNILWVIHINLRRPKHERITEHSEAKCFQWYFHVFLTQQFERYQYISVANN